MRWNSFQLNMSIIQIWPDGTYKTLQYIQLFLDDQKCSTEKSSSSFLQNWHFRSWITSTILCMASDLQEKPLMPCPSIGPKLSWTVQIVLARFWLGPNPFGQVQIWFFWTNSYNLDLSKMIWTRPIKWLVLDQNDLDGPKSIWTHRRTRQQPPQSAVTLTPRIADTNYLIKFLIINAKFEGSTSISTIEGQTETK